MEGTFAASERAQSLFLEAAVVTTKNTKYTKQEKIAQTRELARRVNEITGELKSFSFRVFRIFRGLNRPLSGLLPIGDQRKRRCLYYAPSAFQFGRSQDKAHRKTPAEPR